MNMAKNLVVMVFVFVVSIMNLTGSTNRAAAVETAKETVPAEEEFLTVTAEASPNGTATINGTVAVFNTKKTVLTKTTKVAGEKYTKAMGASITEATASYQLPKETITPAIEKPKTAVPTTTTTKKAEKPASDKTKVTVTTTEVEKDEKPEVQPEVTKEDEKKAEEPKVETKTEPIEEPETTESKDEVTVEPVIVQTDEVSAVSDLSYREVYDCGTLLDGTDIMLTTRAAKLLSSVRKDVERQEKAGKSVYAKSTPVYLQEGDVLCSYIEIYVTLDNKDYLDCVIENQQEGFEINYKTGDYKKLN